MSEHSFYKAASIPTTARPKLRTGPAVWKAPAPLAAVAAALPEEAAPDAERVALADGLLVPEMAVSAAELDAEAVAEAEAEEFELDPQLGVVFKVTPSPLHRVVAKVIVADIHISLLIFITTAVVRTHFRCQLGCRWPEHSRRLR